ncbi:hypothetical protein [Cellulosimicrobium sp. SL-1]|uniref:hypothetical protein n=1 Tax=Cellulosimicrobium sp. SL-1 TaxID=2699423 RepID=UPI0013D72F99|nr:hypothetical protein [Cellulosimicrobium sp. SL-1]
MPQESGPLAGQNFTDDVWRAINGPEPAIVGDVDGSAYALTLPTGTDNALLGSPTQDSTSIVAGFMHRIPAGQTQQIEIPPSTDAATGRTDIIVARYDPAFSTVPGPCRLARVPGVEGSSALPSLDEAPPGVEDFPLWAVTRKKGESLNQAARRWLGRRTGPSLDVPAREPLPPNVPLGTRARRGRGEYVRELDAQGAPTWTSAGAGRLIAVYQFAFANLPPSGIPGREETWQVWGASPQIVGSVAIPDPGVPYRVEAVVAGFFGNEADNNNTRWDFDAMVGATQISSWVGSNAFNQSNQWKEYHAAVSAQVFTGAQTFSLRTRRIYGTGYGAVARANRGGRVAIYEA